MSATTSRHPVTFSFRQTLKTVCNSTHHFRESRDDLAERGERLVDVGSLLQSSPLGAGGVRPL